MDRVFKALAAHAQALFITGGTLVVASLINVLTGALSSDWTTVFAFFGALIGFGGLLVRHLRPGEISVPSSASRRWRRLIIAVGAMAIVGGLGAYAGSDIVTGVLIGVTVGLCGLAGLSVAYKLSDRMRQG